MINRIELNKRVEMLNEIASKLKLMPDGLEMPEQWLFQSLRALYLVYQLGQISRDEGIKEKREIVKRYIDIAADFSEIKQLKSRQDTFARHADKIHNSGCPVCQGLMRVVCGLPFEKEENK